MGLKNATIGTWYFIFDEYIHTKNVKLLKYLTCTEDETIMIYYLEKFIRMRETLDDESFLTGYKSIVKQHARNPAVLRHLISQFMSLKPRLIFSFLFKMSEKLHKILFYLLITDPLSYFHINSLFLFL